MDTTNYYAFETKKHKKDYLLKIKKNVNFITTCRLESYEVFYEKYSNKQS